MIYLKETATRIIIAGPPKELEVIGNHFRYRPPDYWRSPRYQLYKETGGERGWNGFVYPASRQEDGTLIIGRGHRDELLSLIYVEEFSLDDSKLLHSPFQGLTVNDIPDNLLPGADFELDLDQRICIISLLQNAIGCVHVSVSGGKTAIFFGIAALVKIRQPEVRCLYLVPSERLVKQVTLEGKRFLPDWHITQFGGGKDDDTGKDVVVATVSILNKRFKKLLLSGWFRTFTVLLVDECHHLASGKSWQEVVRRIPAFYRFGASDSLKNEREEDLGLAITLRGFMGPERHEVEVGTLINSKRVAKPYIYLIHVPEWNKIFEGLPHTPEPGSRAWALIDGEWRKGTYVCPAFDVKVNKRDEEEEEQRIGWQRVLIEGEEVEVESRWCLLKRAYDEGIIRFKERNQLIVQWAKHFSEQGKPTLIVATRTPHVYILQTLLEREGLRPRVLTGMDSTAERDDTFKWLVKTPGAILISPIVKEGVSLPELRAGIVADPVASPDLARQIIGRFIRKKVVGVNEAEIVMFIDSQYKSARSNSQKLIHELESIRGYSFYYPCQGPDNVGPLYAAVELEPSKRKPEGKRR